MNAAVRFAGIAGTVWLVNAVAAATAPPGGPAAAAQTCETAVADTLRELRGKAAHEVQFGAARPLVPPPADDSTTLAGTGLYRAAAGPAKPFTYTCTYDLQTGKASGVVLREEPAPAAAAKPWEPDLTHLSPEACEAAAAAALKDQYPPAGRIRFESDSRQLKAAPNARTSLEGQGSLERAAGMNPAPFTYRCLLDTGSGRIVSVHTED
jgi:hypothetical protein